MFLLLFISLFTFGSWQFFHATLRGSLQSAYWILFSCQGSFVLFTILHYNSLSFKKVFFLAAMIIYYTIIICMSIVFIHLFYNLINYFVDVYFIMFICIILFIIFIFCIYILYCFLYIQQNYILYFSGLDMIHRQQILYLYMIICIMYRINFEPSIWLCDAFVLLMYRFVLVQLLSAFILHYRTCTSQIVQQ